VVGALWCAIRAGGVERSGLSGLLLAFRSRRLGTGGGGFKKCGWSMGKSDRWLGSLFSGETPKRGWHGRGGSGSRQRLLLACWVTGREQGVGIMGRPDRREGRHAPLSRAGTLEV
jgi:hypothetical protein